MSNLTNARLFFIAILITILSIWVLTHLTPYKKIHIKQYQHRYRKGFKYATRVYK